MDGPPDFMENTPDMRQGARFYYRPSRPPEPAGLCAQAPGIREIMPRGYIHHGGRGFPFLFICFHGSALLNPGGAEQQFT